MAALKQKITPCLWFDNEAEDAAKFYTAVFANSQIKQISRYTEAGREIHGKAPGSVMVVEFELEGQTFTALNGGPQFQVRRSGVGPGATPKTRSIISGRGCRKAARKGRAAGSRTNSACPGRSCRRSCRG
jgi:hypothetical protein